jgi:hypothetical protein
VDERVVEHVEVGAVEDDRCHRDRADPRERVALAVRGRLRGVRKQPGDSADERQHAERKREGRQVLDERSRDAVREELLVLRVPAVHAGDVRERSGGGESDGGHGDHAEGDGEQIVPPEQAANAPLAPAELVPDHRKREHGEQHEQLPAREVCECDGGERDEVVAPRRRHGRTLNGEERPDRGRVGGDLRHHHRGEDDPGHGDGECRREVRSGAPPGHAPREEEGGDARRGHDPGVRKVDRPDIVGQEPVPEERRDQEGIELRVALDVDAVDARHERVRAGDADREPLVAELVVLREPVERACRQCRERRRRTDPEHPEEDDVADAGGEQPAGAALGRLRGGRSVHRAMVVAAVRPYGV